MIGAAADPIATLDPTTRSILTSLARRHARAVATARVGDHPFPRVLFVLNKMDVIPSAVHPDLVTREAATLQLRRELPYDISVVTDGWTERPDGSARVEQVLYVARASQVGIVTGEGGGRVKAIGSAARAEMGRLWGRPVHLFLKVKVRGGWKDERREYVRWGLDYNA
ncbi:hypothetical protein I4F81_000308 [Pyropia yezoensis]|uniref:Uncharacterized protein n=1 Tax=Pyropia yezoensis TaxID=2788 RepID=A0ACC3BIH1_PYRYE|nr:hypothetical protein I4F81_000308 [Neopyropia yezoensis]